MSHVATPAPSAAIATPEALQAVVGKLPAGTRDLKVIDFIDAGAARWLAASPVAFLTLVDTHEAATPTPRLTLAGGPAGFATVAPDGARLQLPLASIDDATLARPGAGFGSLFLLPGLGETLRINGAVESTADGQLQVRVHECYLHCAKALMRADFWSHPGNAEQGHSPETLLNQARLLALASCDAEGRADLSPKGDPAGLLLQADGDALLLADRPGNRRTDSFLNILTQPRVALAALVPGATCIGVLQGNAEILRDEALRQRLAVEGKLPHLVLRVRGGPLALRPSPALARATLWPAAPAPADIEPAALFAAHVKANRSSRGLAARIAKTAVAVPSVMKRGLARDYEENLY